MIFKIKKFHEGDWVLVNSDMTIRAKVVKSWFDSLGEKVVLDNNKVYWADSITFYSESLYQMAHQIKDIQEQVDYLKRNKK